MTLYEPKPEHKFSFGLWTLGNRGSDPFGEAVRAPIRPSQIVSMLAEVGAWGVNLHDSDLVPIDATPAERDQIVKEFKKACQDQGAGALLEHPFDKDKILKNAAALRTIGSADHRHSGRGGLLKPSSG